MPHEARTAIRLAVPADAAELAAVHVRTWRASYVGIVLQYILDGMSVERREAHRPERLAGTPVDEVRYRLTAG